jgi:hypothetical protein
MAGVLRSEVATQLTDDLGLATLNVDAEEEMKR